MHSERDAWQQLLAVVLTEVCTDAGTGTKQTSLLLSEQSWIAIAVFAYSQYAPYIMYTTLKSMHKLSDHKVPDHMWQSTFAACWC